MDDVTRFPLKPRTLAAQALGASEPVTNAIVPPVHLATTYLRDADNCYRSGYVYGRTDNATVRQAEALIAALEHGDECRLFGSGMAAATAVFMALERPSHIVASQAMYWGLRSWLKAIGQFGHEVTFVETSDLGAVRKSIRPGKTALLWIETPGNPLWTISDISALADIAHESDAILCADSTVATPVFTQPLLLGADIVMHSATKYLNGHSDVVAGALVAAHRNDHWRRIETIRSQYGAILGPFEAWLLMRGMRTLEVRVNAQAGTALELARRLEGHPALRSVLYPGLASHPGHDIALRQMQGGFGGMISICVRGGERAAISAAGQVALWKRATSLGGVESLIEHRASIEGEGSPCPTDLLRLSVGLEDVDDLFSDLDRALRAG